MLNYNFNFYNPYLIITLIYFWFLPVVLVYSLKIRQTNALVQVYRSCTLSTAKYHYIVKLIFDNQIPPYDMTFTIWTIDVNDERSKHLTKIIILGKFFYEKSRPIESRKYEHFKNDRLAHDSEGQLFIYAFEIQNLEIGKTYLSFVNSYIGMMIISLALYFGVAASVSLQNNRLEIKFWILWVTQPFSIMLNKYTSFFLYKSIWAMSQLKLIYLNRK